jgi:hypothetical protein
MKKISRIGLTIALLLLTCGMAMAQADKSGTGGGKGAGTKSKDQGNSNGGGGGGGNGPFESVMLSYAAVDKISQDIVSKTCNAMPKLELGHPIMATIVLYDANAFANVVAYRSFVQQAQLVEAAYLGFALPPPPPPPHVGPTAMVFDVISAITQLATATTSQSGSSITIPDAAIVTKLGHDLLKGCGDKLVTVIYPPFATSTTDSESIDDTNEIAGKIKKIVDAKQAAEKALTDGKYPKDSPEVARFNAANDLFAAFLKGLSGANQDTNAPQLDSILRGYQLQKILESDYTYILMEQFMAAGGTMQDRKNLISSLTTGDWISYSGGAVVSYALYESKCKGPGGKCNPIKLLDVERYRTPLVHMQNPTDSSHVREGDNFTE